MGCVQLLPLCSIPKVATREGATGAYAYGNWVGFSQLWFASGQSLAFPNSTAAQDNSRTYQGTVKPNTFSKGFSCSVPGACPA